MLSCFLHFANPPGSGDWCRTRLQLHHALELTGHYFPISATVALVDPCPMPVLDAMIGCLA